MQGKRISVIIPNYNHAAFLRQRVDSVLQQTYPAFEIIILDDHSVDNSSEVIKEYTRSYPAIQFIANEVNSGSTFSQWNKGVAMAKGELLWIAESDDVAKPAFLEKMVKCFEADDRVVLAYSQSDLINEEGEPIGSGKIFTEGLEDTLLDKNFIMPGMQYIERLLVHRNTIPNGSAVVFKKEYYERAGGIPVQIKNTGDWLAWLKILCFGKIAFVAEPLNYFRRHSGSVIAKAHEKTDPGTFKDWYGYEVRCHFLSFLKRSKIHLTSRAGATNASYLATDRGNLGLFQLKNGRFMEGWKLIFQASFFPTVRSGFIKKALLGKNKKDKI